MEISQMTTTDEVWLALDRQARETGHDTGMVRRLVHPEAACSMYVAVEASTLDRLFIIEVPRNLSRDETGDLPHLRNLTARFCVAGSGDAARAVLEVRLHDRVYAHLFSVISNDLVECGARSGAAAPVKILDRLRHWQRFLEHGTDSGLSAEEQRGLYGELTILDYLLEHSHASESTVLAGWRGPFGSERDFEYRGLSAEVKTSGAKQEVQLHISSERQLDWSLCHRLYLISVGICASTSDGESLTALVNRVRTRLSEEDSVATYDDLLLTAGYAVDDAEEYGTPRYLLRRIDAFRVTQGFPCIMEQDLRNGVGNVTYTVGMGSCEPFRCNLSEIAEGVSGEAPA